jgi:hypothetical protein
VETEQGDERVAFELLHFPGSRVLEGHRFEAAVAVQRPDLGGVHDLSAPLGLQTPRRVDA